MPSRRCKAEHESITHTGEKNYIREKTYCLCDRPRGHILYVICSCKSMRRKWGPSRKMRRGDRTVILQEMKRLICNYGFWLTDRMNANQILNHSTIFINLAIFWRNLVLIEGQNNRHSILGYVLLSSLSGDQFAASKFTLCMCFNVWLLVWMYLLQKYMQMDNVMDIY